MGTTAEKLQYTLDSINDIQLAINERGVDVGNDVELAEYGNKIRQITSQIPVEFDLEVHGNIFPNATYSYGSDYRANSTPLTVTRNINPVNGFIQPFSRIEMGTGGTSSNILENSLTNTGLLEKYKSLYLIIQYRSAGSLNIPINTASASGVTLPINTGEAKTVVIPIKFNYPTYAGIRINSTSPWIEISTLSIEPVFDVVGVGNKLDGSVSQLFSGKTDQNQNFHFDWYVEKIDYDKFGSFDFIADNADLIARSTVPALRWGQALLNGYNEVLSAVQYPPYVLTYYIPGATPATIQKTYYGDRTVTLETPDTLGMVLPAGKTFTGWELDGQKVTQVTVDEDITVDGILEPATISFDLECFANLFPLGALFRSGNSFPGASSPAAAIVTPNINPENGFRAQYERALYNPDAGGPTQLYNAAIYNSASAVYLAKYNRVNAKIQYRSNESITLVQYIKGGNVTLPANTGDAIDYNIPYENSGTTINKGSFILTQTTNGWVEISLLSLEPQFDVICIGAKADGTQVQIFSGQTDDNTRFHFDWSPTYDEYAQYKSFTFRGVAVDRVAEVTMDRLPWVSATEDGYNVELSAKEGFKLIAGTYWAVENTEPNGEKYFNFNDAQIVADRAGLRCPTTEEIQALINSSFTWDASKKGGWFGADSNLLSNSVNSIFLPANGRNIDGTISNVDTIGYYWGSNQLSSTNGRALLFTSADAVVNSSSMTYKYSVRGVKK